MGRRFGKAGEFTGVVRQAVGARVVAAVRLRGGSQKGVYRVTLDDGGSVVVYVWSAEENYWAGDGGSAGNAASHVDGIGYFETAHRRLSAAGVRVPRLHLADRSRARYPADVAVLEDVPGESLEGLMARDPARARGVLGRLGDALRLMALDRGPGRYGRPADLASVTAPQPPCEQGVLASALRDVDEAAAREPRAARGRELLRDAVRELAGRVRPRTEYGLVHGELGPDHVLVDGAGTPVLIDFEDLRYFDVEREHAFLHIRFHEEARGLRVPGLDEDRLDFYLLAHRISLVAGPLRLLEGDFPHRDAMRGIAEHNLTEALRHGRRIFAARR
ncbi:phosphotransferase family protein [Streptomyces sp. NPDC050400]|uniref:phosphotransferase family protein n=1 Tax=Streptomyces sp. NPDC050400 TaxID=3365610 RepID=UPI0037B6D072